MPDAGLIEAAAQAAPAAAPMVAMIDPTDPVAVGRLLIDAAHEKNWSLLLSAALVLSVILIRRFGPKWLPETVKMGARELHPRAFLVSKKGAILTTFLGAFGGALLSAKLAGLAITLALAGNALGTALAASGIYSILKNWREKPEAPTAAAEAQTVPLRVVPGPNERPAGEAVMEALKAHADRTTTDKP